MMERLAAWLTSQPDRFAGTPAFAHALLLLAEAASTLGHIRDHVQVRWYPPGSYVVEQGEAAAELFLILSGEAEVWQDGNGGRRERLGRLGVGEFFGHRHRSADVVAAASLTCLVLSPAPPAKFAGRGPGARLAGALPGARADASPPAGTVRAARGVVCCDVSGQVMRRSGPCPPTAASSRWSRACSRSSCSRRSSAANTSWPCRRPARSSGRGARAGASAERAATGTVAGLAAWRRPAAKTDARRHDGTQRDDL